ncbi:unnamed protein product [Heligmosomoides polygyrus]|uniref:SLC12 domain-containing protein n=1 Tax=Heligmosomoides polygyrus TaxID=6339 RepID=A0A183FZ30_HELPZ|nr:unnamed protein product [Heligmosomoides polygyrus]
MSELTDRIKQMGTIVLAQGNLNEVDLSRLDDWDGHLLLAVACAKLRVEKGANEWVPYFTALLTHDGSHLAATTNNRVDIVIAQLNYLTNGGIRYALSQSWKEIVIQTAEKSNFVILPSGFRSYGRALSPKEGVVVCIYNSLQDVSKIVKRRCSIGKCIFVTSTTDTAVTKNQRDRLAMTLTRLARNGTKLVCICGPKDEKAWDENRRSAAEMFDLIREVSAAMKSNIVVQYGQVPLMTERFATMGSIARNSCEEAYSAVLTKEFHVILEEYVAGHPPQTLFDMFQNIADRRSV